MKLNDEPAPLRVSAQLPLTTSALEADRLAALRRNYLTMLSHLCVIADMPLAEHDAMLQRETLRLANVQIAFALEEWSSFIKVFIDVGKPVIGALPDLQRYLHGLQLYLPAPFSLVTALRPQSDHVVLYGYAPMPASREAEQGFFSFLQGCVYVCELLRSHSPLEIGLQQ